MSNVWKPPIDLWSHQDKSIERCRGRNYFALFHDMGTGKTVTAICIYVYKCIEEKRVLPLLVICPSMTVNGWQREFKKIAPPKLFERVAALTGSHQQKLKILGNPKKRIFITNTETLNTKTWATIANYGFQFLIVDESHNFKNPQAKRTAKIFKVADRASYKLIMTGTPAPNSPLDIWAQMRILSTQLFGDDYFVWRGRFFYDKNRKMPDNIYFPDWRPLPGAKEKLNRILSFNAYRVKKTDVLDLPPFVHESVEVELTAQQRRIYSEMESTFVSYLNSEAMVAETVLAQLTRLQQVVAGIFTDDQGNVTTFPSQKLNALQELLETLCSEHKVIVWTHFRPTYGMIEEVCRKLELPYVKLTGEESRKQKDINRQKFIDDDKIRVAIASQQAAGTGTDGLQVSSYAIYYSKTYNLVHDTQSQDRIYRGGSEQHEKVTRIDIVARNTTDEKINEALRSKLEEGELLLKLREDYGKLARG